MHRELNPQLFGPISPASDRTNAQGHGSGGMGGALEMNPSPGAGATAHLGAGGPTLAELRQIEALVHQLKIQVQGADKRSELLSAQIQELSKAVGTRFERVSQALTRLEGATAQQMQEINQKYSSVVSRVNERKVQDAQVHEMIDRHNSIVRAFENRLTHMQRIIAEQEMKLHNSHAALEDARQEIQRLKRL